MNKIKLALSSNSFSMWAVYFSAFSLPLEFIRFDFVYFTTSLTSISLLMVTIILGFLHTKLIVKNIKQNKALIFLFTLFNILILINCFVNLNVHAVGIIIEWFILPIIASIVILSALNKKEFSDNIWKAIVIYIITVLVISIGSILSLDFTYDGRLKSMWHSPNYLAMMISPMIPLILWKISTLNDRVLRYAGLLILVAISGILFATQSVFGVLSVFTGLFIVLPFIFSIEYIKNYKKTFIILSVVVVIGMTTLLISRGSVFIKNIERSSLVSRVNIWDVTRNLISSEPLTGYGLGTFQDNYLESQKFYEPYLEWAVPSTHNTYLMLWFSGGFFMLFIFMFIVFYSIFESIKNFLISGDKKHIAFLASIGIICIHGFVDTTVFGITISHIFWLLVIEMAVSKNK